MAFIPLPLMIVGGVAAGAGAAVAVELLYLRPKREREAAYAQLQAAYEAGWSAGYEMRERGQSGETQEAPSDNCRTLFDLDTHSDSEDESGDQAGAKPKDAGPPPPSLPTQAPHAQGPPPPPLPLQAHGPPPPPLPTDQMARRASQLTPADGAAILSARTAANSTGVNLAIGSAPLRRRGIADVGPDSWTSAMHAELDAVDRDLAQASDSLAHMSDVYNTTELGTPSYTSTGLSASDFGLVGSSERSSNEPRPMLSRTLSDNSEVTSIAGDSFDHLRTLSPTHQRTADDDLAASATWSRVSPPSLVLGLPQPSWSVVESVHATSDAEPEPGRVSGRSTPRSGAMSSESDWFALSPTLSPNARPLA